MWPAPISCYLLPLPQPCKRLRAGHDLPSLHRQHLCFPAAYGCSCLDVTRMHSAEKLFAVDARCCVSGKTAPVADVGAKTRHMENCHAEQHVTAKKCNKLQALVCHVRLQILNHLDRKEKRSHAQPGFATPSFQLLALLLTLRVHLPPAREPQADCLGSKFALKVKLNIWPDSLRLWAACLSFHGRWPAKRARGSEQADYF